MLDSVVRVFIGMSRNADKMMKTPTFTLLTALLSVNAVAADNRLDDIMACYDQPQQPGFAIAMTQAGKSVYQASVGLSDIDNKTKLTLKQSFEIGSVTKQFTAAAMLLLQAQGKLSINDKLSQ